MTTNKTNPIANMAKALTGKAPKKPSPKAPVAIPEFQLVEMGSEIGLAYLGFMTASEALEAVRVKIVKTGFKPIDLRKAKSDPEGAKATKIFKGAFIDSIVSPKLKATVAQNYFEIVAKGIREDKPITSTNPSMAKGKGNAQKSKGGKPADDNAKMTGAILNVWKLSDVAPEALTTIEASIDNGMSLIEAITDYLKLEGVDLTSGESES